jgi:hypothetical protein
VWRFGIVKAEVGQHLVEQRDTGDAVGVEIPIDANTLLLLDRLANPGDGAIHVAHAQRIVQLAPIRAQEGIDLIDVGLTAIPEQLPNQWV